MTEDEAISDRLIQCLQHREQIQPLSSGERGLSLAQSYRISAQVTKAREAAGERAIGRKIGFTNRTIWDEYNVSAPIFGPMYDKTVHPLEQEPFDLSGLLEPRIEPEIAFWLAHAPEPGMKPEDLIGCVSGICAGFELVQSVFPSWKFEAADTVAAFGLHGAFLHGPVHEFAPGDPQEWVQQLASFRTTLRRNGEVMDEGPASNVLGGGPLSALGHLAALVAEIEGARPLTAGEIVTTGTLTRALPISTGETWRASFDGLSLEPIEISLTRQPS
jgi:2-oxo-3-hexenedioate decarboxylase